MEEQGVEAYLEQKQELMIGNLWKLNVADIENTLSRVCQKVLFQPNVPKADLMNRAKALKKLGQVSQGSKPPKTVVGQTASETVQPQISGSPRAAKSPPIYHAESSRPSATFSARAPSHQSSFERGVQHRRDRRQRSRGGYF